MDKIKRLVLGLIPNQKCNLKCDYCYISRLEAFTEPEEMKYSPEFIARSLSKKRLGGVSLINLTGNGETLIQPEICDLVKFLLQEGHYVEVVTNGTLRKRIVSLLDQPKELLTHLFFKLSFHYKELKRLNLLDTFFDNANMIHSLGASFTIELMAYDDIENDMEHIKKICKEKVGAICQATIGRDDRNKSSLLSKHTHEEFKEIWSTLDSTMLNFKMEMLGKKRKEFCYAGAWSIFVNLYSGEAQPCYWQPYNQNIYEDLNKPIKFEPVGHHCSEPYCINAHSHLTWGLIPKLQVPTYAEMRNRKMENGEEWLTRECKSFFESKLVESNTEYSKLHKVVYTLLYPFRLSIWFFNNKSNSKRVIKHLSRMIRWKSNEC